MNDPINFVDPSGLITAGDIVNYGVTGLTYGVSIGLATGLVATPQTAFFTALGTAILYTGYKSLDQIYNEQFKKYNDPLMLNLCDSNPQNQVCSQGGG